MQCRIPQKNLPKRKPKNHISHMMDRCVVCIREYMDAAMQHEKNSHRMGMTDRDRGETTTEMTVSPGGQGQR